MLVIYCGDDYEIKKEVEGCNSINTYFYYNTINKYKNLQLSNIMYRQE